MKKILSIDVGGTFTKFAVMEGVRMFKIAEKNKISTVRTNHDEFLQSLAEIFKVHADVEGIALSMPGLIDAEAGICISSGALNFSNGHNIAEELKNLCGVPVTVENDANCAALAEIKSGALTDVKNAFVLVFGTSIGGAFVQNRKIYRGSHHCAGEVAFTLKNSDAIFSEENFYHSDISADALRKICADILNISPEKVSVEKIFELISEKNAEMVAALNKFAHKVAVKIYNLQMLFDPEKFALGGGISEQKLFIDAVNAQIDELLAESPIFLPRPQVIACKYHNDANLYGALYRYLKG